MPANASHFESGFRRETYSNLSKALKMHSDHKSPALSHRGGASSNRGAAGFPFYSRISIRLVDLMRRCRSDEFGLEDSKASVGVLPP